MALLVVPQNFRLPKSLTLFIISMWTCKPSDDYSLNSKNDLQATGTMYNDEKCLWYWIGTKKK